MLTPLSHQEQDQLFDAVLRLRQKRDEQAMKLLYQTHNRAMLTLSYRITNDLQESEDILQVSFLESFAKIKQLREPAKYGAWLGRMIVNNSLKSRKKQLHFESSDQFPDVPNEDTTPWYEGLQPDQINQEIQSLPAGCRAVFTLYLMEDYKHKEIADTLNISLSTSKSQYRYALKLLREKLTPYRKALNDASV